MNRHQLQQYLYNNLRYGENSHRQNRVYHLAELPFLYRQSILSLGMPDGSRVWGIDVSHWNLPPVNLKRMVELYGLKFVIIKGCDGSLNSKYYFEHVAAAKEAGIPWGKYDWLYPANKVNIDAQINAWHARYIIDPPPLGVFIDAEWTNYGGLPANPNANDLRSAHDKWKNKSGQAAITYTAKGYADTYLISFDWTREELWVASWGGNEPLYPTGARKHTYWQFAILDGKQLDPNGNFELDGNYFNGTLQEFRQRYGGEPTPDPEPPTGGTMKGTVQVTANIRDGSSANVVVGKVYKGDVMYGEVKNFLGLDRLFYTKVYRLNGTVENWAVGSNTAVKDGTTAILTLSNEAEPVPPPSTLPDLPVTITLGDDVKYVKQTVNVTLKPK